MDLHIDNVLMNNGRTMIIDFGLSKFKTNKGVCYDFHLFLNSLRHFLLKKNKRRLRYFDKVLPEGLSRRGGEYGKSSESAASIAKRLMGLRA
jgi:tRNA A-37 threonylcarbamoyl transferase component Bud32